MKRYSVVALVGLLGACQSAANAGFENHSKAQSDPSTIAYDQIKQASTSSIQTQLETKILNQAFAQREELGICPHSFNLEQSKVGSHFHATDANQYLVQFLCFQAAYQGNYAFIVADLDADSITLKPLKLSLAGYPRYDRKTQILSNDYKFRGIGDCIETTEHRWTGYNLELLTSQLVPAQPDSCELFKGGESHRITPTQIGLAKLGMTLGELKAQMGDRASYTPVPLGVDLGMGLEVSEDEEVQFEVGHGADAAMTGDSVITFIRVSNPIYQTHEGVGPGTPLRQASEVYGRVLLGLNIENESREFVSFERGFPKNVSIRSNQWALDGEAGLYADPNAGYRTTTTYKDKAAIGSFTITLRD